MWGRPRLFRPNATLPLETPIEVTREVTLTAYATPGHCEDMVALHAPALDAMFTADLFVTAKPMFMRPEEDLRRDIQSLRRILGLPWTTMYCAHRGRITDNARAMLQSRLDHFLRLRDSALTLKAQGKDIDAIRARLLGPETAFTYISSFHFSKRTLTEKLLELDGTE